MNTIRALAALLLMHGCAQDHAFTPQPLPFTVIEGVGQLTVIDAEAGVPLTLYGTDGAKLVTLIADALGQAHFAYLPKEHATFETGGGGILPTDGGKSVRPGAGYVIRNDAASPRVSTGPLRVLALDDHPPVSHYDKQRLYEGLNYIEMRDGIKLSASVWFPDQVLCGQGPYPTVVEYSGYSPSNPDEPQPGSQIVTQLLCYISVGVNMRGTGCSGGVFDVFNVAQHADGYDIIEVVGRQPFVKFNKVGMVGLSYPGISQLYVAYTNPPHLAAVAPMSVIEDPGGQAWPGGIYNSGFTRQWLQARDRYAKSGGADWALREIEAGDGVCESNQELRSQNVNFGEFSRALSTFPPDAAERRLSNLVPRISVPVFLTGAWQDEQTGSRFATMLDDFTNAPVKRFTMFNGRHPDGYTPLMLTRLAEFFEFYVAHRIPMIFPLFQVVQEPLLESVFEAPNLRFERSRFTHFSNYEAALAAYEAEPEVRILFESGFGTDVTEAPVHRFEKSFAAWPPKATASVWYLGPDGTLTAGAPAALIGADDGIDAYRNDPEAGDLSNLISDGLFRSVWKWQRAGPGFAVAYLAAPFAADTLVVGNGGFVHLWFASDVTDANVEVSVLEVGADGTESLVQTGVLAVKHRLGVDEERSQEFLKEYTFLAESIQLLVPGEYVEVDVPIRPFAHAFRTGSSLRLIIDTPGRDHGFWQFTNPVYGSEVHHRVARTPVMASYLKLPTLTGTDIPDPAPPCHALRGIVCSAFMALPNTTVTE